MIILKAIQKINPNAEVVIRGIDINTCRNRMAQWNNTYS
jgi:hypothetical protein